MPKHRLIQSTWVLSWAFCCAAALGQPAQPPAFEAASVKPAPAQSAGRVRPSVHGGPGTADAGQITFTNATLMSVLLRAYDVKPYQASGPDWLSSERYDIAAKIQPGTSKEQCALMLQDLLARRFHLVLHHETHELQGYELVAGRGGPKLTAPPEAQPGAPVEPDSPPKTDPNGFPILNHPGLALMEGAKGKAVISFLTARSQPLAALTDMLSREFRMPILDKTGLTGTFDFKLEFAPQPPGALPSAPSMDGLPEPADESGPNLISAVRQQLGLRLNPSKIAVDVLIVDRADRVPTEN